VSQLAAIGQGDTVTTPLEALVPAWTPEDQENLERRVRANPAAARWFDGAGLVTEARALTLAGLIPPTTLTITADLGITRHSRATCPQCRRRRVLYAITAQGNAFGASEPRCARCWGIR
jgi:hypothetical protein